MKSSWNISAKCPSASMETLLASGNSLLNIYKVFFHSGSKSASQIIKFLFLVIFLLVYWKIPFHLVFCCCCCYFFFIHYVCIRPTWLGNRVPPRNHSWLLVEFAICIFHFNNYVNHSQGSGKKSSKLCFKYSIYKAICCTQKKQHWWTEHRELLFHKWIPKD